MSRLIMPYEYDPEEQPEPPVSKKTMYVDYPDELEWRDRQNARAQRFLRELYAEREKLLQDAQVTPDNFAQKALQVLDAKGDMELARAILGKYVLSPDQEIRVFAAYRCLIPQEEPLEHRIDLDAMLPPQEAAETE